MLNNEWQPGDMAVCISSGRWEFVNKCRVTGPRPGQLLTVRSVGVNSDGIVGLWFKEFPGTDFCDGYQAKYFMRVPLDPIQDDPPQCKANV